MSIRTSPQLKPAAAPLEQESLVVRLGPLKHKLTDEEFFEFCRRNDELHIEMTKEGEIVMRSPDGSESGHRSFNLTVGFGTWAEATGTGVGFGSGTLFKLPNGAKRAPDLSWILNERWEAIPKKQRKKFAPICPDFVVELRSETDKLETVKAKMEEYLANGAQLGWLIDPLEKKVYVYRPNARVKILHQPATISGKPLLKGLTLKLTGIL